ncbi:MAG: hypothetical protein V4495_22455, partial [Pseudomonadota bacterium]
SSGIEQVNLAITQMDEMTQQNAALVEQAAAAAESMEEQAVALAQAVSVFKLNGNAAQISQQTKPVVSKAASNKPAASARSEVKALPRATRASPSSTGAGARASKPVAEPGKRADDDWEEF